MKPELKAKREKLKKHIEGLRKQVESSEDMTKTEKDAALLNIMMKKEVEEEPEIVEETIKTVKDKHFVCKCGMHVTLYGDAEQTVCSKCLAE
jgi:hypothetical protein